MNAPASLLWFCAKAKWPELTLAQFQEAGLAVVERMASTARTSIAEMAALIEDELIRRHGEPTKR